jgi:hypothetical protein
MNPIVRRGMDDATGKTAQAAENIPETALEMKTGIMFKNLFTVER